MLFQHYLTISVELGPTMLSMSDEELEAWIERLAEGGSAFPFDLLSSDLQRVLILYMARSLTSLKGKSSAGSQQDGHISEENSNSDALEAVEHE